MDRPTGADLEVVQAQLGRRPRGTRAIAHRCPCGNPDVVETSPRLDDGTPFPTLFYLTCPHANAACSRLESAGVMRDMHERLSTDPVLAERYAKAHQDYLAQESQIAKMEAAQAAQREVIADKAGEVAKWQDPEYVRIQARDRLFYVLPGEVPLLIMNDPEGAARDAGQPPPAAAPDRWYETLWSSVEKANSESPR